MFNLKEDETESKNIFKAQPEKAQYLKNKLAKKLIEIKAPKWSLTQTII